MNVTAIRVTKIQPWIGAEISGIDLRAQISEGDAKIIRQAFLDHKVLVFRDQKIEREQHRALANVFVKNIQAPFTFQPNQAHSIPGFPEILSVIADGKKKTAADVWHTDESFRERPPTASVLRAITVPKLGGDTLFSNAACAYAGLDDDMKARIRDLKAMHGPTYAYQRRGHKTSFVDPQKVKRQEEENPPRPQPVVRMHPETGEAILFVNEGYTGPIVGLSDSESAKLLRHLWDQFKKPDYQLRVKWAPNTIVVWDNRAVQHYATADYSEPRRMERITVAGTDIPRGVNFKESQSHIAA